MTASIRERPEWPKLLGHYDPVVDISHRSFVERDDLERFLASLTSDDLDELMRIAQAGAAEEPLAHDLLVVLSRRYDARFRAESLETWRRMVADEVRACRKQPPSVDPSAGTIGRSFEMAGESRLPMAGGGVLLVGPGDVRCNVTFTPVVTPDLDPDDSDRLSIRFDLADDVGRIHAVSATLSAGGLWSQIGSLWGSRFLKSAYRPLVTGLRCYDDSRTALMAAGRVGHVTYPQEEFLKYRSYILDVCVSSPPGREWLWVVIRRHLGHDGITPPYVLFAERLLRDILAGDSDGHLRSAPKSTDACAEPQASVRFHASS